LTAAAVAAPRAARRGRSSGGNREDTFELRLEAFDAASKEEPEAIVERICR
jgi:hypothetical protein